jgi:cytochrome bd-type quinol oxidase subunit 2
LPSDSVGVLHSPFDFHYPPSPLTRTSDRIAVANLVLLVFLALKNTPLAPLTAKSYEKLRPLHKVAGYTCIFTSCLHGIVYLAAWADSGELDSMQEVKNFAGAIAGLAMVLVGLSTITYLMRGYYERKFPSSTTRLR